MEEILSRPPAERSQSQLETLDTLFAQTTFFRRQVRAQQRSAWGCGGCRGVSDSRPLGWEQLSSSLLQLKCCRLLSLYKSRGNGEVLFRHGEAGNNFFIIVRGEVLGVVPPRPGSSAPPKRFSLGPGDAFGERSILGRTAEERKRSATIVCRTPCLMASLTREEYLEVTGRLENVALAALRTPPESRDEEAVGVVWSYLKEMAFFQELRYPLLQRACCARLALATFNAEQYLATEGEQYEGRVMFLLKGGVQLMAEGGEKVLERLRPVEQFLDSRNATQPERPGASDLELEEQRRCANSLVALPTLERLQLAPRTLAVRGLPFSANAREVYNVFAPFSASGTLLGVQLFESAGCAEGGGTLRWAAVAFADARDAQQAERDDVSITMLGTGPPPPPRIRDAPRNGSDSETSESEEEEEAASLHTLEVAGGLEVLPKGGAVGAAAQGNTARLSRWPGQSAARRGGDDALVAVLARADYLESTVEFVRHTVESLQVEVRDRTVEQLEHLERMFEHTAIFQVLHKSAATSAMVRRNVCRFIGVQIVDANSEVVRRGAPADRMYTVISGEVTLDVNTEQERTLSAGDSFGREALEQAGKASYASSARSNDAAVLAVLFKEDYLRVAHTEALNATIDQFWRLGVAHSKSAEGHLSTVVEDLRRREAAAEGEGGEEEAAEGAAAGEVQEERLTFAGYKQLYLRIAKVLAPPGMFSYEERKEMLQDEWAEDKEQFGTAGHDYLLHDEYAMSMYELIDNWCGKVESLELYQKLLQLIFDSMTAVEQPKLKKKASSLFGSTRSLRKKKGKGGAMLAGAVTAAVAAHDEPRVVLKPVRLIEVRYQQLMDMRHMAVKEVVKLQKGSKLSKAQAADRRNKGKSRL